MECGICGLELETGQVGICDICIRMMGSGFLQEIIWG